MIARNSVISQLLGLSLGTFCLKCLFVFHHAPPRFIYSLFAFQRSSSKAGRGAAFLKLAEATRRRWLVLSEFAKYAFFGLKRKRRDFERSVLMYVSIKIPALTHSGGKRRVCVNTLDKLSPPLKQRLLTVALASVPLHPKTDAVSGAAARTIPAIGAILLIRPRAHGTHLPAPVAIIALLCPKKPQYRKLPRQLQGRPKRTHKPAPAHQHHQPQRHAAQRNQ